MRTERPTCRECACVKVCEYFENENEQNLDETCPLCNWENYFVPKQEWISVIDELPETYTDVLYFDGQSIGIDFICSDGTWCDKEVRSNKVTHWMPLPEAPKMKGGAE